MLCRQMQSKILIIDAELGKDRFKGPEMRGIMSLDCLNNTKNNPNIYDYSSRYSNINRNIYSNINRNI